MKSRVNPRFYLADVVMPLDQESYVVRDADTEILEAIAAREYPLLLSSRKVGKSSLLIRTFDRLRAGEGLPDGERFFVAKQELAEANPRVAEESWYLGLVHALARSAETQNPGFEVPEEWHIWWKGQSILSPGQRFSAFLRKYFLEPTTQSWVIAIDEIDTVLQLPFSDDFFAAIRRMRGERASDPVFERLVFLLSGVTTPARLIKDNRRTPFNFGRNISLHDFTAEQACTLLRGLGEPEDAGHPALRAVLDWTGGHPYLTQTVFKGLAKRRAKGKSAALQDWQPLVDQVVRESLLDTFGSASPDPQLQDIAERRIHYLSVPGAPNFDPDLKRRILIVYLHARKGGLVRDDALSPPIVELKVMGLLVSNPQTSGCLKIRNRLYLTVFNERWIAQEMPRQSARRWTAVAATAALLAIGGIIVQQGKEERGLIEGLKSEIAKADTDVPLRPYEKLLEIKGQTIAAAEALAGYWKGKARLASVARPRAEAALFWLKALSIHEEDDESSLQARRALADGPPNGVVTIRHKSYVIHAASSVDGRRVVTASADDPKQPEVAGSSGPMRGWAQVWDAGSGEPVGPPLLHKGAVNYAAFSPDSRWVVTASDDNTAQVWDAGSGEPVGKTLRHGSRVTYATFSPNGRQVVTIADKTARVWDTENGQPIGMPLQHTGIINSVEFSTDGKRVVTAGADNQAKVWNVKDGQLVGKPLEHENGVRHAMFSFGGRRVVTSADRITRMWSVETSMPIGKPLQHKDRVIYAALCLDRTHMVTQTSESISWWQLGEDGMPTPRATIWTNGRSLFGRPLLSQPDGAMVSLLDLGTDDIVVVRQCAFSAPEAGLSELPPNYSVPALLAYYERKLSLVFQDNGAKPFLVPGVPEEL
jgi:hypothetical protein